MSHYTGTFRVTDQHKHATVCPLPGETLVNIDRKNKTLGNPVVLENANDAVLRAQAVAQYQVRLDQEIATQGPMFQAVKLLAQRVIQGEHIAAQCWCKPKACHGDCIKAALDAMLPVVPSTPEPCGAIIGTAGRKEDKEKLTPDHYKLMCAVAEGWAKQTNVVSLVSGAAAWADHVAVDLFLRGVVKHLVLHLPAPWDATQFKDTGVFDWIKNPGGTANHYHRQFSQCLGIDSFAQLEQARQRGAQFIVLPTLSYDPMMERNQRVANQATHVLAMTFGNGATPQDGGTAKTVKAYQHAAPLYQRPSFVSHLDLNNFSLHQLLSETPATRPVQTELGF